MNTTANKLKSLREAKGMSQADCAKALGIDRTTYAKYENGGSVKRNVEKLASFFNVTTDYLLGNEPQHEEYYHDPEVAAIAQEMHDNPDIKVLFHATKGMKKESIEEIRKFVEFQKAKENGFME